MSDTALEQGLLHTDADTDADPDDADADSRCLQHLYPVSLALT